jgi:hypothetical protein
MKKANDLIVVNFSNDKVPQFEEVRGKDWIKYGENNAYPQFLVTLFNRSAKHNAIITAKQLYIGGQGFNFNTEGLPADKIAQTSALIGSANPQETLYDVTKKLILDTELFGGGYLHIIKTKDKKSIAEIYHIDYCDIRSNYNNTRFYYSKEWLDEQGAENTRVIPEKDFFAYGTKEADKAGECLMYIKQYRPNIQTYTLPEYIGAVPAIITDAEIANFHRAAIQNGFQGGTLIVFKNGVPGDEEMKTIERQLKNKFVGTDRANSLVVDFVDDPTRTPEVIPLNGNDFDKRYDALNKTIQEEIFVGHKVTSPMLFGVRVEGQLGGRTEMATAFQLFQNTYVTPKQQVIEAVINELLGLYNRVTIKHIEPIMPDFSENVLMNILTEDEMREIIGRKPKQVQPVTLCSHKFTSEDEVKDNRDLNVFLKFGKSEDEYMSVKTIKHIFSKEDIGDVQHVQFALTNTEKAILDLLKTSPDASAKDVAKYLKITEKEATEIMTNLLDKGYLDDNLKVTPKAKEANLPDLTELTVMYKYALRQDAPSLVSGGKSRPFCQGMMSANRLYTREEINLIGAELGNIYGEANYDAFRRRGGWYTDPNTDIHYPACRHIWLQGVYKKKK